MNIINKYTCVCENLRLHNQKQKRKELQSQAYPYFIVYLSFEVEEEEEEICQTDDKPTYWTVYVFACDQIHVCAIF